MNNRSQKNKVAGSKGGNKTLERYGHEHFKKIGAKGAKVFHLRYKLVPVDQDNFAIVNRSTGKVKAFLNGVPF